MEKHTIAGFAGIGKTVLGKINSEDVIDMEIRAFKYANYKNENIETKLKEMKWLD